MQNKRLSHYCPLPPWAFFTVKALETFFMFPGISGPCIMDINCPFMNCDARKFPPQSHTIRRAFAGCILHSPEKRSFHGARDKDPVLGHGNTLCKVSMAAAASFLQDRVKPAPLANPTCRRKWPPLVQPLPSALSTSAPLLGKLIGKPRMLPAFHQQDLPITQALHPS